MSKYKYFFHFLFYILNINLPHNNNGVICEVDKHIYLFPIKLYRDSFLFGLKSKT